MKLIKYIPNITQSLAMFIIIVFVPVLIGIDQYGYYAKIFSIPSIIAGYVDSYYLSHHKKVSLLENINLGSGILLILFFLLSLFSFVLVLNLFGINYILYNDLLLYLTIFLALTLRPIFIFKIHQERINSILKDSITLDLINIVIYLFLLSFFYYLHGSLYFVPEKLYLLPVFLLCFSTICSYFYAKSCLKFELNNPFIGFFNLLMSFQNIEFFYEIKTYIILLLRRLPPVFMFRSYEDISITILPLVFYNMFGPNLAGEVRIVTSIFKAIAKLFPYRFDLFIHRFKSNKSIKKSFINDCILYLTRSYIIYIPCAISFLCIFFKYLSLPLNNILIWLLFLLSSPLFAINAVYSPYLISINLRLFRIWLIPFAASFLFLYISGQIAFFFIFYFFSGMFTSRELSKI